MVMFLIVQGPGGWAHPSRGVLKRNGQARLATSAGLEKRQFKDRIMQSQNPIAGTTIFDNLLPSGGSASGWRRTRSPDQNIIRTRRSPECPKRARTASEPLNHLDCSNAHPRSGRPILRDASHVPPLGRYPRGSASSSTRRSL